MNTVGEPRILAETGGAVVAEQGPVVVVIDRATGPLATTAFVLGVLATVFDGFGAVTLAIAAGGSSDIPPAVSAVFLAVGVVFAAATTVAVRQIKANGR